MIKRIPPIVLLIFLSFSLSLFSSPSFAQSGATANICTQQQCVKVQNGSLWVLSADNATYTPYFVKAVGYSPTPIGRFPDDWGYAPSDPRSINNNIYDDPKILNRDFSLLQKMNANTIRIWNSAKSLIGCSCTNNGRFPDYMTNANTTANVDTTQNTLDLAASYGLKVIPGFWVNNLTFDASNNIGSIDSSGNVLSRQDIINNFVTFVNTFKGNRAVLFWAIGNENNYQSFGAQPVSLTVFESQIGASNGAAVYNWLQQNAYIDANGSIIFQNTTAFQTALQAELVSIGDNSTADYNAILNDLTTDRGVALTPAQLTAWYSLVNAMAQAAHTAEGANFHPVSVVNGEIAEIGNSADGATDAQLPNLDIWGTNVYRGKSFGTLFTDYAAKSKKLLWISEFGIDAWTVTSVNGIVNWGPILADDLGGTGFYDPATQSTYDTALWAEISTNYPVTVGGSVMEYSDEWWKPYEWYCTSPSANQAENTITAGICNSNEKYFGFRLPTFPDGFANEEWYGVMAISPNLTAGGPDIMSPRTVYTVLQSQWQANPWPSLSLNITGSGTGTISSSTALGSSLSCNFAFGASTGNCTAAFNKGQPVTLSFSSSNNSTITNWGISGCSSGVSTCHITPDTAITVNVTITAPPGPVVSLTSPSNNASYPAPASIPLIASASDTSSAITKVAFYNGTTLLATITSSPYSYTWNNSSGGTYSLTAVATDAKGISTASAPVTITVTNPLMTASLDYYLYSSIAPADVFLSALASVAGGSISKIEFYSGTTLINTCTSLITGGGYSTCSYVWNNVAAGNYSVTAKAYDSNNVSQTSVPSAFTINGSSTVAPSISIQPVSVTVTAPTTATFTVAATGTPAPTYQWQQEAAGAASYTVISGATNTSYTTPATTIANSGTKYECVVSNSAGSLTSSAAILTVNAAPVVPTITTQPVSVSVTAPATATFTLVATGTPAPAYQWQQEAVGASSYTTISGATGASYTTPATTTANSGTKYQCIVTNLAGTKTSNAVTLTVNAASIAPAITTQPVSVTVTAPAAATFTVTATGTPTPTYQWQQEASGATLFTSISGATGASYTTPATTTANSGTKYQCIVTNLAGSKTSNAAVLTVNVTPAAPTITTQPANATVTAPAAATFAVVATGTPAPTYQWQQEAPGATAFTSISGATSASYTTGATATTNNGTKYRCVVSNSAGSVTSTAAILTVSTSPAVVTITSPANGSSLPVGSTMVITASTNGSISSVAFYNGTTFLGSSSSSPYSYVLTNLSSGTYVLTAKATNTSGVVTTSNTVTVTVAGPQVGLDYYLYSSTAPASVFLSAYGYEPASPITKIEFYSGTTLINTATNLVTGGGFGDYSYIWNNLTAGNYSVTIKVYDSNGHVTTSSPVTFTIS